jgi:predicted nuclease with TOPRIM domain
MQSLELLPEITSLQIQLDSLKGKFDDALNRNVELMEAKKLFHEMKILQDRINDLNKDESRNLY